VLTQAAAGAYRAERSAYSDEASHFMNGLFIHDYLTEGLGQNPRAFAENYYLHYPKIAPGMWPPLFHILLGLFLLPGWPPQAGALALVACFTAWAAWRLWRMSEIVGEAGVGTIVALAFVRTGVVIEISSAVMLDGAVAACALEASYWLARYAVSVRTRDAVVFGIFAAASCLIKGNGLAVLLVPVFFIVFTRRFDLLRRPGLYLAALIVLLTAAPRVAFSFRLDAGIGEVDWTSPLVALERTTLYSRFLYGQIGLLPVALVALGGAAALWRPRAGATSLRFALPLSLLALIAAALAFHAANPHVLTAGRYVTMAIAPLLGLALAGALAVVDMMPPLRPWRTPLVAALMLGVLISAVAHASPAVRREPRGWRELTHIMQAHDTLAGQRVVVVSDENGEGALIAEVASLRLAPPATVIRATKLLGSDDWNGNHFALVYRSAADVMRELEDLHVAYLIVDAGAAPRLPFWHQVDQMLEDSKSRLALVPVAAGTPELIVYRLLHQSPGPAKKLRIKTSATVVITEP
jgi:hypothetical protein